MNSRPRRFVLAAAVVVAAAMMGSAALAHSGGLAKDGCHRDRAAGERHWHLDGTAERGGECVKRDGETVKVQPPTEIDPLEHEALKALVATQRAEIAGLISDAGASEDEISGLRGELSAWEEHAREQEARADRAERKIADALSEGRALERQYGSLVNEAKQDRDAAANIRQEAELVLREAEEREHGAGPPARRACRDALKLFVIDADTGWLSSSVKVGKEERAALSAACLSS